jgi:hypothetical protein
MNDSNPPPDLAGRVAALQRQVFMLLLALIVVSGTLVAYLGYESYHLGKDIKAINAQFIQPYDKNLPAIKTFLNELVAYGRTHPDFEEILKRHGIVAPPTATNAAPQSAPATPGAPKK